MRHLLPESEEYLEYLEDDERQRRTLDDRFLREPIAVLQPANPVCAERGTSVGDVVRQMQEHHIGCVLVTGPDGKLEGIFTERDLLSKVALQPIDWKKERVEDYMTPEPETLRLDDHVAWALKLMHVGGYRHVPLTDADGRPVGVVSIRDIVEFIIDLFPAPVLNLPPEPRREASSDEAGGGTD